MTLVRVSMIWLAALVSACAPDVHDVPDATFADADRGDAARGDAGVSPDAGEPVGYRVASSWLLRGAPPSVTACRADAIAVVRLQVLDADARVLDELLAPCEQGSFEGAVTLAWGVRYYGEWVALAADGAVRARVPVSMPIVTSEPHTLLTIVPANIEPRPPGERDFAAGGRTTLGAFDATTVCQERGIAELRLSLRPTAGGDAVSVAAPCDGPTLFLRTERMLDWERAYDVRWEALASDGSVVAAADLPPVTATDPVRALYGLDVAL